MGKRVYLELIRVIALMFIIFNHTGDYGYLLFQTCGSSLLGVVSIFLSNICKTGVPLFFMISGALLLPKQESIKSLFLNRILRLVVVMVLFSLIYYIRLYLQHPEYGFSIFFFIKMIYAEPFITPFWFLYSYLSFLIMLPFLRRMVTSMSRCEFLYFLFGAVILLFLIKMPEYVLGCSINISIPLFTTNILYPVLGYYVVHKLSSDFGIKRNHLLLILSLIINSFCCIIMTMFDFYKNGTWSVAFIEGFTIIPSFVIFYFIMYYCNRGQSWIYVERVIIYIGSCTFCTYLFEEMLRIDVYMKILEKWSPSGITLILCIPYTLAILSSGVIISTILKRIPGVRRLKL